MSKNNANDKLEQYLLKHGPQGFPKLYENDQDRASFENILETNSAIYADYNTRMLRLPEVEKEIFESNKDGIHSGVVTVTSALQHLPPKWISIKPDPTELMQKILQCTLNSNSSFVWGDGIYLGKDNRQKSPTMAEYAELCNISSYLIRKFGHEDKNNITDPFCETQALRKINKAWPSIIKRNPMFFTLNNSTQSTVTWNHSAFIYAVTTNNELVIRDLSKAKAIKRVSEVLLLVFIQNHLRTNCNGNATLEPLLSAMYSMKFAPLQLRLCNVTTSAQLLEFLKKNGSLNLKIEEKASGVTVSLKRNLEWETLCSDLVKEAQQQSEDSRDQRASDDTESELPSNEIVALDSEEFRLFKKRRQNKNQDSSAAPKLSSKSSKARQSNRSVSAKPKNIQGHSSNQKHNFKATKSQNSNHSSSQRSRFHDKVQRFKPQSSFYLRNHQGISVKQRVLNNTGVPQCQSAASASMSITANKRTSTPSRKDLPAPFPDYKPKLRRELQHPQMDSTVLQQTHKKQYLSASHSTGQLASDAKASIKKRTEMLGIVSSGGKISKTVNTSLKPAIINTNHAHSPSDVKLPSSVSFSPKVKKSITNNTEPNERHAKAITNSEEISKHHLKTSLHITGSVIKSISAKSANLTNGTDPLPIRHDVTNAASRHFSLTAGSEKTNVEIAHQQPTNIQPTAKETSSPTVASQPATQIIRTSFSQSGPKRPNNPITATELFQQPLTADSARGLSENTTKQKVTHAENPTTKQHCFPDKGNIELTQLSPQAVPYLPRRVQTNNDTSVASTSSSENLTFPSSSEERLQECLIQPQSLQYTSKLRESKNMLDSLTQHFYNNTATLATLPQSENLSGNLHLPTSKSPQSNPIVSKSELLADVLKHNDSKMHINILFLRCQAQQQSFQNIQDLLKFVETDKQNQLAVNDCWVEIVS